MKKNSMRLLGFLLVAVMMVSLLGLGVFAGDTENGVNIVANDDSGAQATGKDPAEIPSKTSEAELSGDAITADGLTFTVDDAALTATVTDGKTASGEVIIPAAIIYDGKTYNVTAVAGNAFNDANEVTKVTVPNSVTSLGGAAFANMDKLTELVIGNGVTSWGSKLAVNNYELTTVALAEGATLIGDLAFRTCPKLANVALPSTLKTIGATAFAYSAITELTVPASVESIGSDSFKDIDTLKKVTFLGADTKLGSTCFQMCDGLEEVILPANLTSVPQGAFRHCTALKTIDFPETLTEIGNYSFQGCTSLESVTISKNITNLVTNAFNGCTSLKNLTIEEGFNGTIGGYVFQGCTALESVVIPSSMETVGESMFNMCSSLKNVTLSEGVKTLNISAFANCTSLETLVLPDSLERMRHGSIANCSALKTLVIMGDNLPTVEHSNALVGLSDELVIVYSGDDAFTGNWTALADNPRTSPNDVALIGTQGFESLGDAFAAAQENDEVKILVAGTYAVPTGKNITVTGAVDGVVFDNIGAKNMGGANVTFNNVTFDYYPNVKYTGLQHSGNLVYNNCTINGQVFLYGQSETFNNCTFNQNSADDYNVWTYGAKEVAFNECTFNSVGKSVLIYAESASITNDVTVTDCDFIASAPADGKAAIEMDSSYTAGIKLTIDNATVTGFGTGNVSGNSLWNNKKNNLVEANNDITVVVDGVTVLEPLPLVAELNGVKYTSLQGALDLAKSGETITLLADVTGNVTVKTSVTIDGADFKYTGTMTVNAGLTITVQNVNFVNGGIDKSAKSTSGTYTIKDCTFDGNENTYNYSLRFRGANTIIIENCSVKNYRYSFLYVTSGTNKVSVKNVTVENCPSYAVYFSSGVNTATFENLTVKNSNNGFVINNTANRAFTIKDCKMENVVTAIAESNGTMTITCKVNGNNDFGSAVTSQYAKYVLADKEDTLTAPEGAAVTTSVADHTVVHDNGTYRVIEDYVEWVKAQLLAGNSVKLDRDVIITDYDLVNALVLPSNGNGKYTEVHGNGAVFHVIKPGVVFDLNGHSLIWNAHHDDYCNKRQVSLFMVTITGNPGETSDLTIIDSSADKTGKVEVYGMGTGLYAVGVDAKGTISGGTWTNHPCETCGASNIFIYPSHGGELYITDGTFEQKESDYLIGWKGASEPTNNNGVGTDYDATKVEITGGTFVGFNPETDVKFIDASNGSAESDVNGCAEGYMSVVNSDGNYDVVVDPAYGKVAQIGDVYYETFDAAVEAAKEGDTITLLESVVISANTTLDLTGKTLDGNGITPAFRVVNGATLTVKGGNFLNATGYLFILGASDGSSAGNVIIEDGSYEARITIASVTKGTLTVLGGEFKAAESSYGATYMLNCIDANYKDGSAVIVVKGGTFNKFNPANNAAEGVGTNYVSIECVVEAENDLYTVTEWNYEIWDWDDLKKLDAIVESGNRLEDVTVKLMDDINLYEMGEGGEPVTFNPIGANQRYFKGIFDGQGHTIKNMYQSGWALGYDWDNYGTIGLFAYLWNATVKNLTIENAECFVEGGCVGGIAGSAWGNCTFENITVKGSTFATYNNHAGGIVGYTGGEGTFTFKDVTVDEDTVIAGLWGSFDSSMGGIMGQLKSESKAKFENVHVACRIDAYNDCTASYDYYNYRMCGMIIGRLEETTTIDGRNYPDTSKYDITCTNVTVTYGDWMKYHYCDPTPGHNNGRGMRVEAGYSYGGLPADYDHSQCTTHHMALIPFDQLFGGAQYGVDGLPTYEGVVVNYPYEAAIDETNYLTLAEAIGAAQNGDTIVVLRDLDMNNTLLVSLKEGETAKSIILDLNGKTLTGEDVMPVIRVQDGNTVTVTGNGAIVNATGYVFILGASDGSSAGNLTIENGTFKGKTSVASVTKGTLTVEGGYFEAAEYNGAHEFTLNCIDANYKDGSAKIIVKGGTFYKFNPENNASEGVGTNHVHAEYMATADGDNYVVTEWDYEIYDWDDLKKLDAIIEGGNTLADVTVKLMNDIDLYEMGEDGEPVSFNAIGGNDYVFEGIFDGQDHTIKNMYQSGWAFGYEWGSYGSIGLFESINNATVKNLTIEGAECLVEGGDVAGITGSATGTCVFENITITDSVFATYNNGCASIIAWSGAGNYTFKNINIASDVTVAGLWGSFDSSLGGVVGQAEPGATYNFEDVYVACRIDAYNDCTASYDYYNYRMSGMIMGRLEETTTIDGRNYPDTSKYNITCTNVTVEYDYWMDYHYCEPTPSNMNGGRGMRVEAGYSYDGLPADYDHSNCTINHMNLIPFDQLFGGDQYGVKGLPTYEGVTVIYPFYAAQIDGVKYKTLSEAIAAVRNGETITLLANIDEDVTITQKADLSFTIDGADKIYTGTMTIKGGANRSETLTIQNVNFVATEQYQKSIEAPKNSYAHNVTIDNCTFTATGDAEYTAYAIHLRHVYNIKITNTTGSKLFDLVYGQNAVTGLTVENVTVTDSGMGFMLPYGVDLSFKNVTIEAEGAGVAIYNNGEKNRIATFENCTITADPPIFYEEKGTKDYTLVFKGENKFVNSSETEDHWLNVNKLLASEKLTIDLNQSINLTVDGISYDTVNYTVNEIGEKIYNFKYIPDVAQIGDVKYKTLAAAIAAVKNGETIILLADIDEDVTITQKADLSFTIDGADKTYTGTININGNRRSAGAETLTIKNVNFLAEGQWQASIFAVKSTYVHNLIVDGCTFTGTDVKQAYGIRLHHSYNIVVKNTTGTKLYDLVYGNTAVTGFTAENVTVTDSGMGFMLPYGVDLSFKNVTIEAEGAGVAIYNNGEKNRIATFENCTITADPPIFYEEKGTKDYTLVFKGENKFVNSSETEDHWLNVNKLLASEKLTIDLNQSINLTVDGISYDTVNYTVNEIGEKIYNFKYIPDVAQIGDVKYKTLAAAIAAVKNGETITLLADIDENVTITQNADLSFTIDGADKTYTGTIKVNGSRRSTGKETLTIQKVNFVQDTAGQIFIEAVSGTYAHNITVDDCTFTGTDKTAYGMKVPNSYNIVIKNSTGTGLLELGYSNKAVTGFMAEDVTVTDSVNGFYMSYVINASFKDVKIEATNVGIYVNNYNSSTATIEDCTITAPNPVVIQEKNTTKAYTLVFKGTNTFTAGEGNKWLTVDGQGAKVTVDLTGATYLDINDVTFDENYYSIFKTETENVYDIDARTNAVAAIGDSLYKTLQAALNDAKNGETIILLKDLVYGEDDIVAAIGGATGFGDYYNPAINYVGGTRVDGVNSPSDINAVLDLNGYTITNNADAYLFLFMDNCKITIKDSKDGDGMISNTEYPLIWVVGTETLVTIENGKYNTVSTSGLIHVTHGGDLVINGGEFRTSADDASSLIVRNDQDRQNSKYFIAGKATVTVYGGTFYGFDPENTPDDYANSAPFFNAVAEGYMSYEVKENVWVVIPADTVVMLVNKITEEVEFFNSIADAMARARETEGDDTVYLLKNHKESLVVIYDGTTLDLQTYTLEADYVVSFAGGYITGAVRKSSDTYAKLIVPKQFVALAENAAAGSRTGAYVMPVWDATANNNEGAFVFAELGIGARDEYTGVLVNSQTGKEELSVGFAINGSTYVKENLLLNQDLSGLHVEVVASWNRITLNENGEEVVSSDTTTQVYRFSDESLRKAIIGEVNENGEVQRYGLRCYIPIEGHANLTMYARFVTDAGVVICGEIVCP